MKNTHKTQSGFSAAHILLVLIAVAIIGFAGWRVYQSQKATNKSLDNAANASDVVKPDKAKEPIEKYKIPEGYTVYENKEAGFSFAYPKEWGSLMNANAEAPDFLFYAKSELLYEKKLPPKGMQGRLYTSGMDAASAKIYPYKYGPTVVPQKTANGYTWKVIEINPADTKYKVGDVYTPNALTNAQNTTVNDISFMDEGCHHKDWFVETKKGFITISSPSYCGEELGDPIEPAVQQQIDAITKNIFDSIKIL